MLNEVNTLPGMTSYSRYPRMMAAAGVPLCGCDRPDRVVDADGSATMKDDFAFVDERVPGMRWDAKYATWDNFTGKPVDGYRVNRIVGTTRVVRSPRNALEKRPTPWASACFCGTVIARNGPSIASGAGQSSQRTAGRSCGTTRTSTGPRCSTTGYVAAKSGHSRGSTVDLTLYHLATGELVPMGGDHDLMDRDLASRRHADHAGPKRRTVDTCARSWTACGFGSYDREWWHYTLDRRTISRHLLRLSDHAR